MAEPEEKRKHKVSSFVAGLSHELVLTIVSFRLKRKGRNMRVKKRKRGKTSASRKGCVWVRSFAPVCPRPRLCLLTVFVDDKLDKESQDIHRTKRPRIQNREFQKPSMRSSFSPKPREKQISRHAQAGIDYDLDPEVSFVIIFILFSPLIHW